MTTKSEHVHKYMYNKEASRADLIVTICEGCGDIQAKAVQAPAAPFRLEPKLPSIPAHPWTYPRPGDDPWKRYPIPRKDIIWADVRIGGEPGCGPRRLDGTRFRAVA